MKLRTAAIVPGTEQPPGDGVHGAARCLLRVEDEPRVLSGVVKRLPLPATKAEWYCAMFFRHRGLPVPEPVAIPEGQSWAFGSLDAGYPSLKQRLMPDDMLRPDQRQILVQLAIEIICHWEDAPIVLALDELIANPDRNIGNVLWDGTQHSYIDHEQSLGCAEHTANLMAKYAIKHPTRTEECQKRAVAVALMGLNPPPLHELETPEGLDFADAHAFVQARIQTLAPTILTRFPPPDDLLSGLT